MSRLIKSSVVCADKIVDGKGTMVCDLLSDGEYFISPVNAEYAGTKRIKAIIYTDENADRGTTELKRGDDTTSIYDLISVPYSVGEIVPGYYTEFYEIEQDGVILYQLKIQTDNTQNLKNTASKSDRWYSLPNSTGGSSPFFTGVVYEDGTSFELKLDNPPEADTEGVLLTLTLPKGSII